MTIAIDATDIIDAIAGSTRKNTQHKSSFYPTLGSNLPSFSKRNTRIKNSNIYSKLPLIEKETRGKIVYLFSSTKKRPPNKSETLCSLYWIRAGFGGDLYRFFTSCKKGNFLFFPKKFRVENLFSSPWRGRFWKRKIWVGFSLFEGGCYRQLTVLSPKGIP